MDRERLIPAHAGKTQAPRSRKPRTRAHPRACGENLPTHSKSKLVVGSSPRMRGKHLPMLVESGLQRLIPAHAGKTAVFQPIQFLPQAHPRACGENLSRRRVTPGTAGSSPRMRGKPGQTGLHLQRGRLIPAHAGKTVDALSMIVAASAHPRACGENGTSRNTYRPRWGSSPRMRGKLPPRAVGWFRGGLIPAHAGKTSSPAS